MYKYLYACLGMVFKLKAIKENMHRGGVCIKDHLRRAFCLSPRLSCPFEASLALLWSIVLGLDQKWAPAVCTGITTGALMLSPECVLGQLESHRISSSHGAASLNLAPGAIASAWAWSPERDTL